MLKNGQFNPEAAEFGMERHCWIIPWKKPQKWTGVYQTPQGYYVRDEDVEVFDREFAPKEKLTFVKFFIV